MDKISQAKELVILYLMLILILVLRSSFFVLRLSTSLALEVSIYPSCSPSSTTILNQIRSSFALANRDITIRVCVCLWMYVLASPSAF